MRIEKQAAKEANEEDEGRPLCGLFTCFCRLFLFCPLFGSYLWFLKCEYLNYEKPAPSVVLKARTLRAKLSAAHEAMTSAECETLRIFHF